MNNRTRLRVNAAFNQWTKADPEYFKKMRAYQINKAKRLFPHTSWRKRAILDRHMEQIYREEME